MKVSEFRRAVDEEFGEVLGRMLVQEQALDAVGSRTAAQALAAGVPTADVWRALCAANQVPPERWHGRGRPVRG
ncbi:DUF3046 domain-containing protein [uncultured Amnibacterium sp.]|uniref:DUF3046 domain-containing protein n=1 Tax=uncultured Amnibacterium sp. TaxID=1631851 RepID=UPI0035CB3845